MARHQFAASPVLSALLLLASAVTSWSAECPAFAGAKAACGETTCGHFAFKGKFDLGASKAHRVKAAPRGLRLKAGAAPGECCRKCRGDASCTFWNFFSKTATCYLYSSGLCISEGEGQGRALPYVPGIEGAFVGGRCNEAPPASNPAGANVTFPMLPERTFCLLSDPDLHINMLLGGYLDERTAALGGAPRPRVWIREVGFVWAAKDGVRHTLRLAARRAPRMGRGDGFLGRVEVDGTVVPQMMLGDEVNLFNGQASILFDAFEKSGPVDVDRFSLRLEGILEADLFARPAHPLLQHRDDAMVHLNLDIGEVQHSPSVHGVLGQTYRRTKEDEESNLDYNVLSQLITGSQGAKVPFALEGRAEDYWSSAVLAPDCKFSQFGKAQESQVPGGAVADAGAEGAGEGPEAEIAREAQELAAALAADAGDEVAIAVMPSLGTRVQAAGGASSS